MFSMNDGWPRLATKNLQVCVEKGMFVNVNDGLHKNITFLLISRPDNNLLMFFFSKILINARIFQTHALVAKTFNYIGFVFVYRFFFLLLLFFVISRSYFILKEFSYKCFGYLFHCNNKEETIMLLVIGSSTQFITQNAIWKCCTKLNAHLFLYTHTSSVREPFPSPFFAIHINLNP